jgi:small subunit ribosomal protein S1
MEDTSARTSADVPSAASEQATQASTQQPLPTDTSSAGAGTTSSVDAGAESPAHAAPLETEAASHAGDETDGDADESSAAGDEAGAAPEGAAEGTAKRKRRRRRKRKDGSTATSAGDVGAITEGGEPRPEQGGQHKPKKESHAPFAHRFSGAAGNKRHAFAVNEVVAGRVQRVEYGVIVVDLFGKAIAMADEYEPREIPVMPEPVVEGPEAQEAAPVAEEHESGDSRDSQDAQPAAEAAPEGEAQPVPLEREVEEPAPIIAAEPEPAAHVAEAAPATDEPAHAAVEEHHDASVTASGELHAVQDAPDAHEGHEASDEDGDDDHDHDQPAVSIEPPREKPEAPAIGQVFKGRVGAVAESGHIAILNRLIDTKAVREQLGHFREQHKRVHGMVFGYNRGGFDVLVEGLRAFCPASAMSLEDIAEPLDFVGKKLEFLLPASKAGSKDIIVSRRSILERLQRRKTKEFLRGLTPGQRFKGRVTAVRDFGLFVDLGGVEGLVHQSELSYAFGVKPSNVAKVGDEVEVQVLRVGGEPKKQESGKRERLTRVSLSVKALLADPWDAHAAALTEGAIHKGKIVRAAEFGAFIEIAPEVEGLLHITELGRDLKHANQAVREGDEIYVAVERVDRRARRVSLSKLSPAEVQEYEAGGLKAEEGAVRNLRQGQNVQVKIERIEPRCVFGRVVGTVGRRGRAFIPSSETGTDRGTDLRKRFPIGTEIEAKIIGIDRDGSLKCSIKAMQIDEERQAVKNYRREAAKQGFGTFGDLLRAKLGEAQK